MSRVLSADLDEHVKAFFVCVLGGFNRSGQVFFFLLFFAPRLMTTVQVHLHI